MKHHPNTGQCQARRDDQHLLGVKLVPLAALEKDRRRDVQQDTNHDR